MADQDSKKTAQKVKCEVCEKEMCKSSLKTHMKNIHKKKEDTEDINKKKEEDDKNTEQGIEMNEEAEDPTKKTSEFNKEAEDETQPEESEDETKKTTEVNKKAEEEPQSENMIVVHDLINLDTKELDNLLQNEEEFLDAVETLEDNLGLNIDLTVNESMIAYIQDEGNYRSDFARTMELEVVDKSTNEQVKLQNQLNNAKKTIAFLRQISQKDKKYIKRLEDECVNGAKEYKNLSKKYKTSRQTTKKLDESLKSSRELLAKTSSENIEVKQKLKTKQAAESATKDVIVIENAGSERNSLACEKCDFVAKSKEKIIGHNKFVHLECHVCRKHCDTATELNAHIEHVHNLKPYDCKWCSMTFPNHTGFEVHRQEKHEVSLQYQCDKCRSKFQKKEQLLKHIMNEHVIKCIFNDCGLTTETEGAMIKHMDKEHLVNISSETTEININSIKKGCRYFKQGRCTKGVQCKFEHIESNHKCDKCGYTANTSESLKTHIQIKHSDADNSKSSKLCRNGDQCVHKAQNKCKFLHKDTQIKNQGRSKLNQQCKRGEKCIYKTRGTCFYFHKGIGIQSKRDSGENKDIKFKLWCKFQDKCSNTDCKFQHFESNFVQKPATQMKLNLGKWLVRN